MSFLITLLIALLVVALILYVIQLIPLPAPFKTIAYVIVAIIVILWLVRASGLAAI